MSRTTAGVCKADDDLTTMTRTYFHQSTYGTGTVVAQMHIVHTGTIVQRSMIHPIPA